MTLTEKLRVSGHFHPVSLPPMNPLASAVERILRRWPDIVPEPPERDRERLVAEMKRRLDGEDWAGARMSLVMAAARAAFDEERRYRVDLAPLRRFYIDEILASDRHTFLGAMLSVYVGSYVPRAEHTRALANALRQVQDRLDSRSRILITQVPDIFDPDAAHEAVAAMMDRMESPWDQLKKKGLRSPHAAGLMDHAHLAFVGRVAPKLSQRSEMERLIVWLRPEGQRARSSGGAEAIAALLDPWRSRNPSQDDERYLTTMLVDLYGDPRVVRDRAGPWAGVPEPLLAVIMRWLTGENIRFFLDVVSAVEDSHMWEPRRKFWLGLHNQKRIDAAWVAFSREGADLARRKGADRQFLRFGRQEAGGSRANTSLLILKIGSKIVVEGSHSYRIYVFKADAPRSPKLYGGAYDCDDIRNLGGAWSTPHLGDWQGRVLEQI
jgi:hypothetical protein